MIRWNGRTDEARCTRCPFDCRLCKWRLRWPGTIGRAGSTVVLDMDDPATSVEMSREADEMERADDAWLEHQEELRIEHERQIDSDVRRAEADYLYPRN